MSELVLSNAGRRYGFIPSPPDHRDFGVLHSLMPKFRFAKLPGAYDLEPFCGPVFDQGQQGSCTANAGCGNFEYLLRRFKGDNTILSRSFLYYMERKYDGTLDQGDCGSTGRSSCMVMLKNGVCPDSDMPYSDRDFTTAPSDSAVASAILRQSGAFHVLPSVMDMKSCIASEYPCIIGFAVFQSFESSWNAQGFMPIPEPGEGLLGYHEVLLIGYNDAYNAFKVRNSWGGSWGLGGNFWMPYSFASNPDCLVEARIQHLGKAW